MRPRRWHELASALQSKGFRRRDSHHIFFELLDCGKPVGIRTKISQGRREISRGLQGQMATDLHLRSGQFDDLIECPLSGEGYRELMRRGGHL